VTLLLATSFLVAVTGVPMMYLSFAATGKEGYTQRLNMELDLQSLFFCPPPAVGLIYEATIAQLR